MKARLNKTLAKVHYGNVYYMTRSYVSRIFPLSCFWSRSMRFGKLNYHTRIVSLLDTHGDAKKEVLLLINEICLYITKPFIVFQIMSKKSTLNEM